MGKMPPRLRTDVNLSQTWFWERGTISRVGNCPTYLGVGGLRERYFVHKVLSQLLTLVFNE